jgi:dipeptidase E
MRMYLSSFRLGTEPTHLVRLAGKHSRIAVIANAIDTEPADARSSRAVEECSALRRLGLSAVEIDLRRYFDVGGRRIAKDLASFDAVWVRGGNVFVLRHALAASGADLALVELLHADRLVYAGYSAGPCVLGPSLEGLDAVDDPEGVVQAYGATPVWAGLGLLDERIVPHVESPTHPESAALDEVADQFSARGIAHRRLRDGEALVIHGSASTLVGRPATVSELMAAASRDDAQS